MRQLILISALLLASVTAQAGQTRSLVLASNDEPKSVETAKPTEAQATTADVKTEAKSEAKPEASKPASSKPAKKTHARRYEGDEAKARRIAARYGVYW